MMVHPPTGCPFGVVFVPHIFAKHSGLFPKSTVAVWFIVTGTETQVGGVVGVHPPIVASHILYVPGSSVTQNLPFASVVICVPATLSGHPLSVGSPGSCL